MYVVACFLIVFAIAFHFFGWGEKVKKYLFNSASLEKKVENIIKTDLSSKYARASFYIGNNYHHKMSQADWQKYCQENIDNTLDKNSQEYVEAVAPILNAIVLDKEGYYLRRGMENLERSLQRFLPGVNDRISLNYYVEPYEYFENKELAAKSLAEEALRKKKYEEQYERVRPIREAREAERKAAQQERQQRNRELDAAYARCRGCANNVKCRDSAKRVPGACGGYIPK
ncbi:MAG: hypothetical protein E7468_06830 [Ruminococcaceae bacterium]|nr:hypothetical protein [Oscillospiraceae bacterium]